MPVGIGVGGGGGATFSEVIARVINLLGTDNQLTATEVQSVAQTRFETLYDTWNWSRRLRDFTITTFAQVQSVAGALVTVSHGSSFVAASPPFVTTVSNAIGAQIALSTEQQYFFLNPESAGSGGGYLGDGEGNLMPYPGASASASTDISWRIFQTIYTLPAIADSVESLAWQYPLREFDGGREALDRYDPYRQMTAAVPTHWLYAGESSLGIRELELWPVPTTSVLLRGQYLRMAPILTSGDTVPIPLPLLVYGTAADCCHLLHAKQGSTETMWENKALFFERKMGELEPDYKVNDLMRTSPPMQLGRRRHRGLVPYLSGDYLTNHDTELP